MLSIICRKSDRKGRSRLAGLIGRHGADMTLPDHRYSRFFQKREYLSLEHFSV